MFSSVVADHWIPAVAALEPAAGVRVVVDPSLDEDRALSWLAVSGGAQFVAVTPARASVLLLVHGQLLDADDLAGRIADAGIVLNDPDALFYLPVAERETLRRMPEADQTRQLSARDDEAFARFTADAPDSDLDDAFVELDHWLVYGTFADRRLVAAASMYPWRGSLLADLGVITLPEYRGRGLGCATVRAMSAQAIARGYEPQYRSQLDNASSLRLASAAGFVRFGDWRVAVAP